MATSGKWRCTSGYYDRTGWTSAIQVILSTAHPAKFKDTVVSLLNNDNFVTEKVKNIMKMKEDMIILDNDATMVKKLLMDNIV